MTIENKNNCSLYESFGCYYIYNYKTNIEMYLGNRYYVTIKEAREKFKNYIKDLEK